MAKVKYYTTLDRPDDVLAYDWEKIKHIKKQYEYDGIAYLLRNEGIPLLRKDLGTTENISFALFTTPDEKCNLGVEIMVPEEYTAQAKEVLRSTRIIKEAAIEEMKRTCLLENDKEGYSSLEGLTVDDLEEKARGNTKDSGRKANAYILYVVMAVLLLNFFWYVFSH